MSISLAKLILERLPRGFLQKELLYILAISGGRDSMLLLHAFHAFWRQGLIREPILFHLHHGLRSEAEADLQLLLQEARSLDLALYYQYRDVAQFARRCRIGLEEAGRLLRYRLLARLATRFAPAVAVTAHHADDYVESLLMHLIRGGGPAALATLSAVSRFSSRFSRGRFLGVTALRPFVYLSQQDISKLAADHSIPYSEDLSNYSQKFLRNRIRSHITPLLRKEGLDPALLWKNFHPASSSFLTPSSTSCLDRRAMPYRDYPYRDHSEDCLSIDRRLWRDSRNCKQLLDLALRSLELPPASRRCVEECQRQIERSPDFRLRFESSLFTLWSDQRGPVWIFRQDAALWQPFHYRLLPESLPREETPDRAAPGRAASGEGALGEAALGEAASGMVAPGRYGQGMQRDIRVEVSYNHRKVQISLSKKDELILFRPGLRIRQKGGSRKLKKFFQEIGLPPPVRRNLPLILDASTGEVRQALLMLWK